LTDIVFTDAFDDRDFGLLDLGFAPFGLGEGFLLLDFEASRPLEVDFSTTVLFGEPFGEPATIITGTSDSG
jgi:hypothetical protein